MHGEKESKMDNKKEKDISCVKCEACKYKKTHRNDDERKKLLNRINRIVGQLSGIKGMIEDDRYCGDILLQVAAAENALNGLGVEILAAHLKTCVSDGVKNGDNTIMDEAIELIKKMR